MSFTASQRVRTVLLIADVPNLDMVLAKALGGDRPTRENRPRYDVLKQFVEERYDNCQVLATAFMNAREENYSSKLGWHESFLKPQGWNTFIKPQFGDGSDPDEDIDEAMIAHIQDIRANPAMDLVGVLVVSHDAKRFSGILGDLAREGVQATYVVFTEFLSPTPDSNIEIVDLRDIPDISPIKIADRRFSSLPREGMWV